jgi:hypothetical protein
LSQSALLAFRSSGKRRRPPEELLRRGAGTTIAHVLLVIQCVGIVGLKYSRTDGRVSQYVLVGHFYSVRHRRILMSTVVLVVLNTVFEIVP